MISKPKISVIMSAYNAEKYISESIESILNQTEKNFELIIVNDASTDRTIDIIKKYKRKDKRIKVINNKKNVYAAISRNKGIRIAKGKYIAIQDADDLSLKDRLKFESKYLDENKSIFLVSASFEYIDENSNHISTQIYNFDSDSTAKELLKRGVVHNPTVMFRNDRQTFYRDKVYYSEDRDLWLNLLTKNKKLIVLPKVAIKYRLYKNSISNEKRTKQEAFIKKALEWYHERLQNGFDRYNSFDPQEILSEKDKGVPAIIVCQTKVKLIFKNENNMSLFRKSLFEYFRKYGLFRWKLEFPLLIFSYSPGFMRNLLRKAIWGNDQPTRNYSKI